MRNGMQIANTALSLPFLALISPKSPVETRIYGSSIYHMGRRMLRSPFPHPWRVSTHPFEINAYPYREIVFMPCPIAKANAGIAQIRIYAFFKSRPQAVPMPHRYAGIKLLPFCYSPKVHRIASSVLQQISKKSRISGLFGGGAEESRTPVRKPFSKTFYERSR